MNERTSANAHCARCGEPDPSRTLYPPGEWVEYLRTERSLSELEGALALPLCTRCHDRLGPLRDAFRRADRFSAAERERLDRQVAARLEELDLEAVIDDAGSVAPDERRQL